MPSFRPDLARQVIGVPHAAILSVVFGLFLAAFPMGAFVVFASDIGGDINYELPLTHLDLFEGTELHRTPSPISVGDAFVVIWALYLVIFAVATLGPSGGFGSTISGIMAGRYNLAYGRARAGPAPNYMLGTVAWFSILVLASVAITAVQSSVGIATTPPAADNRLIEFLHITFAPIVEETGFRLLLVGVPVFLLYADRFSPRYLAGCLWRPGMLEIGSMRRAAAVIVFVGVMFGFLHIALGDPWSEGKFAQATAGGIILGWAYVRYGFVTSVLIHWASNYFVFSHVHFISQTHIIAIEDAFSHTMISSIEIILVICGILSAVALYISTRPP